MKTKSKPSMYKQLLDLAMQIEENVIKTKVSVDSTDGTLYTNTSTDVDDYILRQAVVILDVKLFGPLSAKACKLVFRVIEEMCMNNVFWMVPETDPHLRSAIAELVKHEVLLATEVPGTYIVSPFKLRRGKAFGSIMASLAHYHKTSSVVKLEDLRPPTKALIAAGK